jgi:hypothetical protein
MYKPLRDDPTEIDWYNSYFNTEAPEFYGANETDIYVLSFNNALFVEYQIKTLAKFYKDGYNLIIVDNNNWLHPEASEHVRQICYYEGAAYIKAPDNYYQSPNKFDPSMKLGTTMNWIYQQCVKKRQRKYFGFLDHDCFLIKNFDLAYKLDHQGMYGRVVYGETAWNLHVTANFFKYEFVKHLDLDFRASWKYSLDTGGANYDLLYNAHKPELYDFHKESFRYAKEDVNRKDSVQHYEIMDGAWFHICASSHDQLVGDGQYKLAYAKGFLDAKLL